MKKRGFTLVEIIVVLIIIAILAAALIPTMSGVIERADDSKMITETRTLLSSVQYLLSEHYVETGREGDTAYIMDYDEAVALAEVPGTLEAVTYRGIMDVEHLQYLRDDKYCLYCRDTAAGLDCDECDNTTAFTVTRNQTLYLRNLAASASMSVYNAALNNLSEYFSASRATINSVDFAAGTAAAEDFYASVPASDRAFLESMTWKVMNTGNGLRLYFVLDNFGTESSPGPVRVYKYVPDKGYQFNDQHPIKNGVIDLSTGDDNRAWGYGDGAEWGPDILLP